MTERSNYDFSRWSKAFGPQPTEAELAVAHALATRGPGEQSFALAMAMRACGVTQVEMKTANAAVFNKAKGTPHNNHMTDCERAGSIARDTSLMRRAGEKGEVKRFTLTAAGQAFIDQRLPDLKAKAEAKAKADRLARAAELKAARAARKAAKAVEPVQPVSEAPAVEPVTEQPTA